MSAHGTNTRRLHLHGGLRSHDRSNVNVTDLYTSRHRLCQPIVLVAMAAICESKIVYPERSIAVLQDWLNEIHVQQPEIETWRELDVAQPPVPRFERPLVNHFVESSQMRGAVGDLHISLKQYILAK